MAGERELKVPLMGASWIRLRDVEMRTYDVPLMRPFKFGMVELRSLVHLRLWGTFEVRVGDEVRRVIGGAGENLAPKWFEKRPGTTLDEDVAALRSAVNRVVQIGLELPGEDGVVRWWEALYTKAAERMPEVAGLVRQLGVSLLERAAIEAWCKVRERPFWQEFGGEAKPVEKLIVRHTIGLSDEPGEVPGFIRESGIRRLKVKLKGDPVWDVERVRASLALPGVDRVTVDGNENYASVAELREFLSHLRELRDGRIAWVEQALKREVALSEDARPLLTDFREFPQVMDESDDSLSALPRALALGYAGTTHKNCKGVFKSLRAAALLRDRPGTLLSGEDLTIVAPWSMAQDLAAATAVGVVDIERNGHHYADGLAAFGDDVSREAVRLHPGLYELDSRGVGRLIIRNGELTCASVNVAPFGW